MYQFDNTSRNDRVASQAQTHKPPANYKTAEFQLDHGQLDRVVARKDMTATLAKTLAFFGIAGDRVSPTEEGI